MREVFINKAKAVSFTGHRVLYKDFSREKLLEQILSLIEDEYDTFLVGMALGFDTECFLILEKIRETKPIKIVACIPCIGQEEKFNEEQKELYKKMVTNADERVILSDKYTNSCMMERNRFMVDNSSLLISYKRRERGGTAATVRYAEKQNLKIINL